MRPPLHGVRRSRAALAICTKPSSDRRGGPLEDGPPYTVPRATAPPAAKLQDHLIRRIWALTGPDAHGLPPSRTEVRLK
jgi:hypothetical protein